MIFSLDGSFESGSTEPVVLDKAGGAFRVWGSGFTGSRVLRWSPDGTHLLSAGLHESSSSNGGAEEELQKGHRVGGRSTDREVRIILDGLVLPRGLCLFPKN